MSKFQSRKLWMSVGVIITATALVATDKIGGGEWVTMVTLCLAMYKAANVFDGKNGIT